VAAAQHRFDAAIEDLDDADVRRPSRLPGWTVGHVLTHVARNADSHRRRTEGAARNEVVDQYQGGYAGREAEIEAGANRPASELIADVRHSGEELQAAWLVVPDGAWDRVTRDVGGRLRRLDTLVARRRQELEIHLTDLGIGVTHRDWPDDFVAAQLLRLRQMLPDRLPDGVPAPAPGTLDERDALAWLFGRLERSDLPALAPWD
jgi:maleylpyruvate isomerase